MRGTLYSELLASVQGCWIATATQAHSQLCGYSIRVAGVQHEQLPGDVHSTLTKVCGAIEDSLSAGHFAAAAPAAAQTPDAPAAAATPSKADKKAKRRRDGDAAARRNGAQPAEAAAGGAPAEQNTAKRKRSEAALHMDSQPGAEPAEAERGGSPDPVKRKKKKKKEKKHGHIQGAQQHRLWHFWHTLTRTRAHYVVLAACECAYRGCVACKAHTRTHRMLAAHLSLTHVMVRAARACINFPHTRQHLTRLMCSYSSAHADGQGPEVTEPQATAAAAADGASIPAAVRDNGAVEAVQRKKKKRKHREAEPD